MLAGTLEQVDPLGRERQAQQREEQPDLVRIAGHLVLVELQLGHRRLLDGRRTRSL